MKRLNAKEMAQAVDIVLAESNGTFRSREDAESWLVWVHKSARILHGIYTRQCNGYSPRQYAHPARAESRDAKSECREVEFLKESFRDRGLSLYLNGDPRGNPVGILTPKTGRYNTMGGAECGWRL